MNRVNILFENISSKEYLEFLNLEEMPELGDEIELTEGLKVINRTAEGIGILDTIAFELIYPIIAGVASNLLASYLEDFLKRKKHAKAYINGKKIYNKNKEEIEDIIEDEKAK